jgi:hypothetical protein
MQSRFFLHSFANLSVAYVRFLKSGNGKESVNLTIIHPSVASTEPH